MEPASPTMIQVERDARAMETTARTTCAMARDRVRTRRWAALYLRLSATAVHNWTALTRYLGDGRLPPDNNWIENRIRPIAIGRSNWLFAGSLRAGQRAAAIMSLIGSAKMNGLDPYAYLRDVLERLPTQPASRIAELLPHRWQSAPLH